MIIYNVCGGKIYARACVLTAQGVGREKHKITSAHHGKHNELSAHTHHTRFAVCVCVFVCARARARLTHCVSQDSGKEVYKLQ